MEIIKIIASLIITFVFMEVISRAMDQKINNIREENKQLMDELKNRKDSK